MRLRRRPFGQLIVPMLFLLLAAVPSKVIRGQGNFFQNTEFDLPKSPDEWSPAQKTYIQLADLLINPNRLERLPNHMRMIQAIKLAKQFRDEVGKQKPLEYILAQLWMVHFMIEEGKQLHQAEKEIRDASKRIKQLSGQQRAYMEHVSNWLAGKLKVHRGVRSAFSLRAIYDSKNSPDRKKPFQEPVEHDLILLPSMTYMEALYQLRRAVLSLEGKPLYDNVNQKRARELLELSIKGFETKTNKEKSWANVIENMADYSFIPPGSRIFLPKSKTDLKAAAGRIYFHHALACTLEWDLEAARKSLNRMRELAPSWRVTRDKGSPKKGTPKQPVPIPKGYDGLGQNIRWFDDETYTSHMFHYRAIEYRDMGMKPEMVLDLVASYLTCEEMFKEEYKSAAKGQKIERLRAICRNLDDGPLIYAFASCEYADDQQLALQAVRAEAICGFPEKVLSSFSRYLNDFHKHRVPYAPEGNRANVLQNKGNLGWTIKQTNGLLSNSVFIETQLDSLVSNRSLSAAEYHKKARFYNGYLVRETSWTAEEQEVLSKFGFPNYVVKPIRTRVQK